MQRNLIKRLLPLSFILSFLLHLLLLLGFAGIIFFHQEEKKKPPDLYVPSYVFNTSQVFMSQPTAEQKQQAMNKVSPSKPVRLLKIAQKSHRVREKIFTPQRSVLDLTNDMLQQDQQRMITSRHKEEDPIYLVGDKNNSPDPLVRLIGRALSLHFSYPREAGMMGIKGKVIVGLVLQPDGNLTDVQLLQSSDNQDLDAAAMYAANSAPIVKGANKFIARPRHFVVGFVFR